MSVRAAPGEPPALRLQTAEVRSGRQELELRVDGEPVAVELDPRALLLDPERANDAIRSLAPRRAP